MRGGVYSQNMEGTGVCDPLSSNSYFILEEVEGVKAPGPYPSDDL